MLKQAKCVATIEEGRQKLHDAIYSGAAFDKFVKMIEAQGGDISYILHPEKFPLAKNIIEIHSDKEGYVNTLNALEIGVSSMRLGGGRETLADVIDMSAGIVLNKKVGDHVNKGELLCTLHTNKGKEEYEPIMEDVRKAYVIVEEPIGKSPVIKEIIDR